MPAVIPNDQLNWEQIEAKAFDAIVISPGPGHPGTRADFGVSSDVIRYSRVPVLGICLGHQGIALEFGGAIERVEPAHGVVCVIEHAGDEIFHGVPSKFHAVRYHSLAVRDPLPPALKKIAWTADGQIMALRHISRPLWGVQFHPESILSEHGEMILRSFLGAAS